MLYAYINVFVEKVSGILSHLLERDEAFLWGAQYDDLSNSRTELGDFLERLGHWGDTEKSRGSNSSQLSSHFLYRDCQLVYCNL